MNDALEYLEKIICLEEKDLAQAIDNKIASWVEYSKKKLEHLRLIRKVMNERMEDDAYNNAVDSKWDTNNFIGDEND